MIHCARRVHTPEMTIEANLVKQFAPYRYDNFWGFRDFMASFFKILNGNKNISRDVDIDESVKKASVKKDRHVFKHYRLKKFFPSLRMVSRDQESVTI